MFEPGAGAFGIVQFWLVVPAYQAKPKPDVTVMTPALMFVSHQETLVTCALSEAFPVMRGSVVRALPAGDITVTVGLALSVTTVSGTAMLAEEP